MDLAKYGPWALVVGGSEGVGAEFARKLAARGFKLVLTARKTEPLEALKAELGAQGAEVRILSADLTDAGVLDKVRVVTDDIEIGLLVYNAGANSVRGNFVELPIEVTRNIIQMNVMGQADFARHYGNLMCQRGRGGMILTGSQGGYAGSSQIAAYSAAKSFCRTLAEGLWLECGRAGVDVLHLNIGFTATPAMERLGIDISKAQSPEEVAQEGIDNIANGPVFICGGEANIERARKRVAIDNRGDVVRAFDTPPRDKAGEGFQNAGAKA